MTSARSASASTAAFSTSVASAGVSLAFSWRFSCSIESIMSMYLSTSG